MDQNYEIDKLSTMQVSVLHGIRDIRLESRPVPQPGPGEVLLKVASVGVCGSDVHYYNEGRIGNQVVTEPIIMGHEFSAHVALLGEGVQDLNVGQLVAVDPAISCGHCEPCLNGHSNLCPQVRFCGTPPIDGVFSEYCVMPASNCFLLPEGMTAEEGSLLEPLGVALHSVVLSHLKPGDSVAVLGAGPIGILTSMVARIAGASRVYVTEPLAYRREFALARGVDAAIDPIADDPVGAIMGLTGGRGVDIVFEAAGADETPEQAGEMVCIGGKIILVGIPASDNVSFTASTVRRKGVSIMLIRRMKHTYPRTIQMVADGSINLEALITHRLPLSGVGEAMELLSHYRDGVIKAVINP
jgi:L-iditol 2-dehydrogenase